MTGWELFSFGICMLIFLFLLVACWPCGSSKKKEDR